MMEEAGDKTSAFGQSGKAQLTYEEAVLMGHMEELVEEVEEEEGEEVVEEEKSDDDNGEMVVDGGDGGDLSAWLAKAREGKGMRARRGGGGERSGVADDMDGAMRSQVNGQQTRVNASATLVVMREVLRAGGPVVFGVFCVLMCC